MMNGLNLLKASLTKDNYDDLSIILGYEIDSCLKLFYSSYELGKDGFLNAYRSFDQIRIPINFVEFRDEDLGILLRLSHFYNRSDISRRWREDIQYNDVYKKYNLLPIAYTEISLEQIYTNPKDGGEVFIFRNNERISLSDNIFEFCSKLTETEKRRCF